MKRAILLAAAVAVAGCGVDQAQEFRDGFPKADEVKLNLPGGNGAQPLSGASTRRDGLEGQVSLFYAFTRGVTVTVNGGAAAVLLLVEEITEYPPSAVTQDSARWGPHTEPLSPNTWRFTVTRHAPNEYSYVLEGKAKTAADTEYRAVLTGAHVKTGHKLGTGTFLVDWDAAQALPEHDANVGRVGFAYARPAWGSTLSIDAAFDDVRDPDTGQRVDAQYRFREFAGNGGSLEFQVNKNVVTQGAALEVVTVKSRWAQSGAGRSDARVSGGDAPGSAVVSECWDAGFLSRYAQASWDPALGYGDPAACAFPSAEFAQP
ncbi:MAG: hypothetical protein IT380_02990 [Myxococcales bacterium]|nr:hypothetical protein [Myxococcales bacterium]